MHLAALLLWQVTKISFLNCGIHICPGFAPASIMPEIVAVADVVVAVVALLRSVVYVRQLLHRFIYNLFSLRLNNTQIGHVKAANMLQHVGT